MTQNGHWQLYDPANSALTEREDVHLDRNPVFQSFNTLVTQRRAMLQWFQRLMPRQNVFFPAFDRHAAVIDGRRRRPAQALGLF